MTSARTLEGTPWRKRLLSSTLTWDVGSNVFVTEWEQFPLPAEIFNYSFLKCSESVINNSTSWFIEIVLTGSCKSLVKGIWVPSKHLKKIIWVNSNKMKRKVNFLSGEGPTLFWVFPVPFLALMARQVKPGFPQWWICHPRNQPKLQRDAVLICVFSRSTKPKVCWRIGQHNSKWVS